MKKAICLKKLFLAVFFLCASVFADSTTVKNLYPKQHRGFYSSQNFGVSFIDFEKHSDDDYAKFSGVSPNLMEFRFGIGIGNVIAFYTQFNLAVYIGSLDWGDIDCDDEYKNCLVEDEESEDNVAFARSYIAFGTSIYPFRDTSSALNGFFVGTSFGYGISSPIKDIEAQSVEIQFTVEIGKDWWVSDQLSLGVGIAYFRAFPQFEALSDLTNAAQGVHLLFRITRG